MAEPPVARPHYRALRHVHARPRLFASAVVGLVVALLIPAYLGPTLRAVIGWDCAVVLFLAATIAMAVGATPESMRARAALEDEARWMFLALMAGAAFFSMFAILGVMRTAKAAGGDIMVILTVLAGITVLLSWLFAHTIFAVHYAHGYFNDLAENRPPGLDFPGEHDDPDYWDFLYFSFVVGMTAQVSDVQVLTPPWRRLVLAHGIVAFLFNTVVLALSINLLAGFF
ncbi:MAG TPA: DUF1345 domain-containing protein [Stellaceae bacterium]|nr:DUF1345 domain-containing protein [Stellaceae bacterium]